MVRGYSLIQRVTLGVETSDEEAAIYDCPFWPKSVRMTFEALTLEVEAAKSGPEVVKPPALRGRSGIEHKFATVVSDGSSTFGFDFCQSVTDVEVLRSYIKEYDTGASVHIVCLGEKPSDRAVSLAAEYELRIVYPESLSGFFSRLLVETRSR